MPVLWKARICTRLARCRLVTAFLEGDSELCATAGPAVLGNNTYQCLRHAVWINTPRWARTVSLHTTTRRFWHHHILSWRAPRAPRRQACRRVQNRISSSRASRLGGGSRVKTKNYNWITPKKKKTDFFCSQVNKEQRNKIGPKNFECCCYHNHRRHRCNRISSSGPLLTLILIINWLRM